MLRVDAEEPRRPEAEAARPQAPAAPGPSAPAPAAAPAADALGGALAEAVRGRPAGRVVQRQMATRSKDFDKLLSIGSRIAPAKSTFGVLKAGLVRYEKATTTDGRVTALHALQHAATEWLNEHASSKDKTDVARRPLISGLVDQIAAEQAALSRLQGQDRYLEDSRTGVDAGNVHGLQGISGTARYKANEKPLKPAGNAMKQHGLTRAEIAAIQTFTVDDYKYINPTTANSPGWMANQRARFKFEAGDDVLRQEGPLHTAVAMQGLMKLPAYEGDVYRGASMTDAEFNAFAHTDVWSTSSLASASKVRGTALSFAYTSAPQKDDALPPKTNAVVFEISDSGGRDIQAISLVTAESEVLLPAGASYLIRALEPVPTPAAFSDRPVDENGRRNPVERWWVAKLVPLPSAPAPAPG